MFHRVGSSESEVAANALDIYEVVAADGTQWGTLLFDMYHPRQSTLAPPDLTLRSPGPSLSPTAEFGYGTNQKVEDFPFGLPAALRRGRERGDVWAERRARQVEQWLSSADFRTAARQINRSEEREGKIIIGPMDAEAAMIFQRMKVAELYGKEGEDWTQKTVSVLTDGRTIQWNIALKDGSEKHVLFDISQASTTNEFGGSRMLEFLGMLIKQNAARERGGQKPTPKTPRAEEEEGD